MKELLPRERFIRTLRHEPVDRVSVLYRMKAEAKQKIARVFGVEKTGTGLGHDPSLELRLGNDAIIYQIGLNAEFSHRHIAIGETWFNHFGVGYGKSGLEGRTHEEELEFMKTQEFWGPAKVVPENFPKSHPVTSMEQLKNMKWPDPNDRRLLDPIKALCEKYKKDYFIIVDLSSTLIEAAYAHIVGTQNFFLMTADEPDLIDGVLDGLTEYYTALGINAIKEGADMIRMGDDVGAQQSMMLSPKMWRKLAKPRLQHMFDSFRKENPDIFIKFHSCGDYSPILPDIVDLGCNLSGLMQPSRPSTATSSHFVAASTCRRPCLAARWRMCAKACWSASKRSRRAAGTCFRPRTTSWLTCRSRTSWPCSRHRRTIALTASGR
jgi:uroporphyrinogen decarboxylase